MCSCVSLTFCTVGVCVIINAITRYLKRVTIFCSPITAAFCCKKSFYIKGILNRVAESFYIVTFTLSYKKIHKN